MEENDRTFMEAKELYMKYRESRKGQVMRGVIQKLNQIAKFCLNAMI